MSANCGFGSPTGTVTSGFEVSSRSFLLRVLMDLSVDFPLLTSVSSTPNPSFGVRNLNGKGIGTLASSLNVIDLESVTTDNNEHLEIQADDTPTVRQIKSLNAEVRALRAEVEEKRKMLASHSVRTDPAVLAMGPSWKDKVSPPTESPKRMDLQYFPPELDGEKVKEIEIGQNASSSMGNDMDTAETEVVVPGPSEIAEYGFLPSDLGDGMTDPDAVFLALKSVATDEKQPSGGKKPGATKKPRNSKKK
ncbi:hypothetical protein RHMOL_Rhmol07G0083700 [Rhododendron molle]|uniref:Uncharacterized protein n=1 Tax=Rhododendron molle TaxID=49168 RepID=A0ACC0MYC9_RHOML|nr:hypothetical protein RHMOL_Rhmol07G0083700 [Rhododendron molle]